MDVLGVSPHPKVPLVHVNDIAEANTHRVVVLPKNSYQGLLARNELEQADRRVRKFVR